MDRDYKDKIIISSTHEKFRETLISLGFKEISLEEISAKHQELLGYFQRRDKTILRFIRE